MKFRNIVLSVACGVAVCALPLYADRHSSSDVEILIQQVQARLVILKQDGAETYAHIELEKVKRYVSQSSKFLAENENDKAYYEIVKARSFFQLIKARKEYIQMIYRLGYDNKSGN